jgi:iron complex outermembrane receptor protein
MSRSGLLRGASVASLLVAYFPFLARAQESLPPIEIGQAPAPSAEAENLSLAPGFQPSRAKLPIYRDPPGQTVTTVDHKFLETTPMYSVKEMLQYSPGVVVQPGNASRELNISIRGSGNRFGVGYPLGIRNIMMYEDGFPIVTADGTGRADILDPHAFSAVDVYRGPSSSLFGNYALGGAINFRTFSGAEIDGVQTGSEFGSFGYINNYIRAGKRFSTRELGELDVAMFASDARGDGYLARSAYEMDQARILVTWSPVLSDRFTLKFLFNDSFSTFMNRESQSQYYLNPFGKNFGCPIAVAANLPFCNNLNVPANGVFTALRAPLVNQSVWQLGSHIHSPREIAGFRWEHDFDNNTTWRSQFTYDYFDYVNGTWPPPRVGPAVLGGLGGPVAIRGPSVGLSATTDITSHGSLFGLPATHYLGFFYDNVKTTNPLFNQLPNIWNYGAIGAAVGKIDSYNSNISLRAREEIALTPQMTAVLGFSSNWNRVWGVNTVLNYASNGAPRLPQQVAVDNDYWNTAPEASLTYRYSPEWQVRARYAAGYGTPAFVFLTNTQNGAGNNSTLKAQTNMGVDLGVDWTPSKNVVVSLTGFNEWFRNELLTLSNGLVSYQSNAPASIHRGVELNVDWRPYEGWRFIAAYTFNDQFFTNYWDNLGSLGGRFVYYNRSGNRIPNVSPHTLTARVGYDLPSGDFAGLGAYAEYVFNSGYTIDNANFTSLPGYGLVNLNLHYSRDIPDSYFKNIEMYLNLNNAFNRTYIAGSFVMANTLMAGTAIQTPGILLSSAQGAGIIAGQPRSLVGGVKFKF